MERLFLIVSGVYGFLAVALGAFGAHGLQRFFDRVEDGARRAEWWATATQYHLVHAVALGVVAWVATRVPGAAAAVAGWGFVLGVLLFSGSLYAMALTGTRWLGMVTPFGGLCMLVGWVALALAAGRGWG
ncbi:MAG: DUF423 domain-containing protein [Myxococcota bacterium]